MGAAAHPAALRCDLRQHAQSNNSQEMMSVGPVLPLLWPHLATTPHDNNDLSQPELRVLHGQLAALRRKGHLASHAVTFFTTRLCLPPVRVLTLRRKLRTSNSKR